MIRSLLALLLCGSLAAADWVTGTLTITNVPNASDTIQINASTRTWVASVSTPSTEILIGADEGENTTNLWNQVVTYGVLQVVPRWGGSSNVIDFIGMPGTSLTITLSDTYGSVTYVTNTVTALKTVRVPMAAEQNIVRTNVATLLVTGLNDYAQLALDQNDTVVSELVGLTNAQTITGAKTATGAWTFGNIQTTNLVNVGNAISSVGSAAQSEQLGSGATATAAGSLAVGYLATASGSTALQVGNGGTAAGDLAINIGGGEANGDYTIVLGHQSEATSVATNSMILGRSSSTAYTNSILIGRSLAGTADNQIIIGDANHNTSIPGVIDAGTITNTTYHGTLGTVSGGHISSSTASSLSSTNTTLRSTTTLTGITKITRTDIATMGNGDNPDLDPGTATYIKIDGGPTGAFGISSIQGGSDGRMLIIENRMGYNFTIYDEGATITGGTAANRIWTPTEADYTSTTYCVATLIYDSEDSRWHLINWLD